MGLFDPLDVDSVEPVSPELDSLDLTLRAVTNGEIAGSALSVSCGISTVSADVDATG